MWLSLPLFVAVLLLSSFVKLRQKPTLENHIHKNLLFKSFSPRSSCFEFHIYVKYIYFLILSSYVRYFGGGCVTISFLKS